MSVTASDTAPSPMGKPLSARAALVIAAVVIGFPSACRSIEMMRRANSPLAKYRVRR